jgi:ABC-type transporter Mla MlaB component
VNRDQEPFAPDLAARPAPPAHGHFSISRRSDPVQLVLAGEIDVSSVPALAAVLPDAADDAGVLHVDLADVYFCDLAALRVIIGLDLGSEPPGPRPVRPVVLHRLPASLEKILRIIGWDTAPGLTIDSGCTSPPEPRENALSYEDGHH